MNFIFFKKKRYFFILKVCLVSAVFISYYPAWNGGPIWDDNHHITKNSLRSFDGLTRIWTELGATQQYYPIVHTVFWIEHRLWGNNPSGYHLINILLHALSVLILIRLLNFLRIPGAWLAGVLWGLHPLQVESVAWISELKNVLSGIFFLCSGLLYLHFDMGRKKIHYTIALLLFILGLLSKSVIAMLPIALLAIFWWQRGTLSWKRDILPLFPFFTIGIVSGLFTAWVERIFVGAEGSSFDYTIIEKFLIAGRVVWFYLVKIIWPWDLMFIYPRWNVNQTIWWQYLFPVATLTLIVALWILRKKTRFPLAAFVYYVAMIFPVLGFFNVYPFKFSFVADHFQYLTGIGPIVLVSLALHRSARYFKKKGLMFLGPVMVIVVLFIVTTITWRQSHMYFDAATLYRMTIQKNSGCWMAFNNLGVLLMGMKKPQEAIENYTKAIDLFPNYAEAHNNIGNALISVDQSDKALYHFKKALEIRPDYAGALNNLGLLLIKTGRIDDAIESYKKAIELEPDFNEAWNNLGNALLQKGCIDEASICFKKAVFSDPFYAAGFGNLGIVMEKKGDLNEAIILYEKAITLDSGLWEIQFNLGNTYMKRGRIAEAISNFIQVTKKNPGLAEAWSNLGNAFRQSGRLNEAYSCYIKALEINPNKINTIINSAGVLAQLGRKTLAIDLLNRARNLAINNGDTMQVKEIDRHLSLLDQ